MAIPKTEGEVDKGYVVKGPGKVIRNWGTQESNTVGFAIFCHGRLVRALTKCNSCNDEAFIKNGAPNRKAVTKDTELQFLEKGGRSTEVFGSLGDINVF